MEENVRSLVIGKNEEEEEEEEKKKRNVVNENCLEGKLPCGTKVKSEPPEDDSRERGLPRVAVDGAEDVKIKPPGPEDRFSSKVQDAIPPCVDGVGSSSNIDSSINVVQKEELENIELNSLGESSLVKLKRRIRLRLLAEEARNSIARKAELAALEDEISIPSSKITTRTRSSELSSRAQTNYQHDEKPVIAPAPALPVQSRNRIVNLSSESEDEDPIPRKTESEPSQLVVEKDHPPATTAAAAAENSYFEALQRLLGPLLSAVGPTDSSTSISAAEAAAARKPGRPARRSPRGSDVPAGRKATESVSSLVNILKKTSAAAGAGAGDEGRPKGSKRRSKPRERERREAATQDSALEYEQERADNIRRNKEFLAQLGLSSTLHSMSTKRKSKRGRLAGSKSQAAAAAAAAEELYENSKHHNVEEIMLQLCALRAAAAAQAQAQALRTKRPRLFEPSDDDDEYVEDDDDEDEDEDEDEGGEDEDEEGHGEGEGDGDGDGESETAAVHASAGRRPKKNARSRKRTSRDKILRNEKQKKQKNSKSKNSSKKSSSKATSSSSEMSRGGKSSKDTTTIAGKSNNPRAGRRTTIPSAVLHGLTSSNQELIRFVSELISSASHSLPPTLLDSNASPAAAGHDDSDRSPRRDDNSDRGEYYTSHDDDDDDDSPRGLGGDSCRKRKDTWLTMIPFETPKTEYELERDEILRRHKHQFERLGIVSELIEEPQPPRAIRPYCRRWASEPDPAYQRNTRFQDRQRRTSMQPDRDSTSAAAAAAAMDTRAPIEAYSTSSAPSSVAKFTGGCKLQTSHGASGETAKLEATDTEVSGFQPLDGTWLDPDLNRIYTMDLAPICASSPKTGLLAAGGSQGRLAVFAVSDADSDSASRAPLLSWAVDSSWVSQVVFVSNQFQEHGTLLLSSSNDGRVVLWDINKQRVRIGARGFGALAREVIPVVVCESSELHSGGIFGMHEFRGSIATSSDGCVAISILRETGITVDRFIAGHHAGVIRSVRFREQNVLADCGVDTVIGILDLRASDPCTLRIQTTHKTGISMVEWSPVSVDSNLVLSASNDPQLYVHDIRYGAKAMLQLEGHVHPRRVKCYSIYRPTFVAGGDAIVTPGEGTHQLSLYSVTTGSAVKKLHVGYDPNILLWSSAIPSQGGVWAGSRGITKFQVLWQQRGSCQVQT